MCIPAKIGLNCREFDWKWRFNNDLLLAHFFFRSVVWVHRENALRLEEKEKKERELLSKIIEEAEDFKVEFHKKREVTCQSNKAINREREKSIADLIPNEVPALEKKKTKKDQEQKPSIMVVQGPKPGKPTELSRLRHILLQLKHNTPPHLKLAPPPPAKDPKASDSAAASTSTAAAAEAPKAPEPVAVA
ncbi:unnamed protein product [Linum tenue]|uniref:Clathrin light chain n=1 Tax=Linum tenue TaxID=586396 RepID=A0AAV0K4L7_9ROSI|nr:unnamed protein product [Linum tenue]